MTPNTFGGFGYRRGISFVRDISNQVRVACELRGGILFFFKPARREHESHSAIVMPFENKKTTTLH